MCIRDRMSAEELTAFINSFLTPLSDIIIESGGTIDKYMGCLLYTSDAADERSSVDLGGRRIIKKQTREVK